MRVECFEESVLFCFALCRKTAAWCAGAAARGSGVQVLLLRSWFLRLEVAEGSTLPAPSSPTAPKRRCRNGGSTSGTSSSTLQDPAGPEVAFATNGEAEAIALAAAMDGPRRYGNKSNISSRRFFFMVKRTSVPYFQGPKKGLTLGQNLLSNKRRLHQSHPLLLKI